MMRYVRVLNPTMEMDLDVVRGTQPLQPIKIPSQVEVMRGWGLFEMIRDWEHDPAPITGAEYEGNVHVLKLQTFMVPPAMLSNPMGNLRNASAVIIDLRGNGGGALDTMTYALGYFGNDPHELGQMVFRDKKEAIKIKPIHPGIRSPAFVLVDSYSASAAEMFARDLQLQKRATIIGDQSSGRVNSARMFWEKVGAYDLVAFGTEIAVAKVIMASGEELENRGVTPDEFCVPSSSDLANRRDPCLEMALTRARNVIVTRAETIH